MGKLSLDMNDNQASLSKEYDNGTEFMNSVMEAFCQRNGIIHEMMNPYCLQQNGIAKRAIAIFLEMTRCMLHGANMDLCYWGKAFMHAVYIQLLTPTSALQGRIPYTEWFDSK